MSDFVVMRKGAIMAIASPSVTSIAINKPIDAEELGGWKLLTGVSGLADMAVETDEQADIARRVIEQTQPRFRAPIVTEIEPAQPFWRAEEYHQCYLEKRPSSGLLGTLLGH